MRSVAAYVRSLCLAVLMAVAVPAAAQEAKLVSNVFLDTDLRQAIADVAAQAEVNIIADPSVAGLVSLELENATVEKALELLLAGSGYRVYRADDYYLVYTADQSSPAFTAVAETQMVPVRFLPAATARGLLPEPLQRYARVEEASNQLAVTAPADIIARIVADLGKIDQAGFEDTVFVPLTYVKAATARQLLAENLQRFVRVDQERNTLAITAPFGSRDTILAQLASLDAPRAAGSFDIPDAHRTQIFKLENARATAALALLPEGLRAYVRADEESNTLAISAPPVLLNGILTDIATIDVKRHHIMLDARVVVLERGDLLNFGGGWKWPEIKAGLTLGDFSDMPWEMRIGYSPDREFTNALSLTLNLLSANDEATVVASPQVLAQDGRKAEIRVTTEEYFQITDQAAGNVFIRSQLETIETGTILGITPQVGPNGQLTLDMEIEVSDVISRGERNLPVVSRRIAKSIVQIENGGTAAVAGLINTRTQTGQSGVPNASAVPILGHAFKTDTLNHRAQQVAVFVTATIVDQNGQRFETGRKVVPPPIVATDMNAFRAELEAVLGNIQP